MGKNNFYPEFGVEAELPTYVYGIGVGHDQETVKYYNPQKRVLLHLTVNGCGIAEINGKRHMLPPGSLLCTPPGKWLLITPTPSGWIDNWIGVYVPAMTQKGLNALSLGTEPRILRPENPGEFAKLYESVARSLTANTLEGRLDAAADAYKLLILAIKTANSENSPHVTTAESRIVFRATSFIDSHLAEPLPLDRLCETCGKVSQQYLCRVFKNQTGMTLGDYILSRRLAKAKDLLAHTELSVSEIAAQSGFGSDSYFYRCWKRTETDSPTEYRRTHTGVFV